MDVKKGELVIWTVKMKMGGESGGKSLEMEMRLRPDTHRQQNPVNEKNYLPFS